LRIVWTDDAVANLEAIFTFVSAFNPAFTGDLADRLIAVADSLAALPHHGER
jgi:plasmid stabilization system protein ParE